MSDHKAVLASLPSRFLSGTEKSFKKKKKKNLKSEWLSPMYAHRKVQYRTVEPQVFSSGYKVDSASIGVAFE